MASPWENFPYLKPLKFQNILLWGHNILNARFLKKYFFYDPLAFYFLPIQELYMEYCLSKWISEQTHEMKMKMPITQLP